MRCLLVIVMLALGACSLARPPTGGDDLANWRTRGGHRLSRSEVRALLAGCYSPAPQAAIDPLATVSGPASANPAYRPGGAGLMSASPTGITRAGAPVAVTSTPVGRAAPGPPQQCLERMGLVRDR